MLVKTVAISAVSESCASSCVAKVREQFFGGQASATVAFQA